VLEDSCFYSSVPAEVVTITILTARHSSLWTEKLNLWNKQVFLSQQCAVSKVIRNVRSAVFRPWHRSTMVLLLVFCPVHNTLLEVSPEIRCSDVSSRYCCYGNHAAGSRPI